MRRIRYIYDITETPSTEVNPNVCFSAEEWITDKEALNRKQTKMLKMPGKFRRFTIDRKDEIFKESAIATGATRKVRLVEVEE
jgi:colicin import membrane protein